MELRSLGLAYDGYDGLMMVTIEMTILRLAYDRYGLAYDGYDVLMMVTIEMKIFRWAYDGCDWLMMVTMGL